VSRAMKQRLRPPKVFQTAKMVHTIRSWDDLLRVQRERDEFGNPSGPSPLILIDELNLWAPSRRWQSLEDDLLYKWSHNRKHGLDIWWTAQHESRVDKVVREVTEFYYVCRRFGPARRPFFFVRRRFIPALITDDREARDDKEPRGMIGKELSWFRRSVAESFDTYEDVKPSEHLKRVADARRVRLVS